MVESVQSSVPSDRTPWSNRLGILLSGAGSTYANLAERIRDGRLRAEIAVVVASRAGCGGVELARRFGHPVVVAAEGDAVTAALRAHCARWVAMCGWMRYWDPPGEFAGRTLNIHPSLLPDFGGRGMYGIHVHRAVLGSGGRRSGCTVHLVSGAYDSGCIVGRREVPVIAGDTAETLQARVQAAERELYPEVLATMMEAADDGAGG